MHRSDTSLQTCKGCLMIFYNTTRLSHFKKQLKTEIFLLTSALKDLPHQISEGSVKTLSQCWCPDSGARLNVNVSIGVGHLL